MNETPAKKKSSLSPLFQWSHATSVNGGAMLIAATIASYFSLYAQETIGITAAQLSVILFICTLWDAINDPMMGVVCDTLKPRWGRYRTWFTFPPVLLLIDMFLLFSYPKFIENSQAAKCIYVCLTYMCYGMIVTAYTMPQMAILPAMTLDDQERNSVIAKGAAVCAAAFTIASTWNSQLVELFGGSGAGQHGYRNLMCTYAVLAIISFWLLFKSSEERYVVEKAPGDSGIGQLKYVFRHKEIWPVMLCWCLASVSYGFMFTSSVYYAQYVLAADKINAFMASDAFGALAAQGEEAISGYIGSTIGTTISTYMGFVSFGALFSMMVLMPIFLKVFKTGYKSLIVSQILTIICYVLLFITGRMNFMYCCVVTFIATLVGAMVNALVNVLVNDTIDFVMLKEGKQLNGIISSVKGFAQKCGNTITNSGMLAVLAVAGFDAQLGALGQAESAINATVICRFMIPAVVSGVILIIMIFYPLKKYFPEIEAMKAKMAVANAAAEQK